MHGFLVFLPDVNPYYFRIQLKYLLVVYAWAIISILD